MKFAYENELVINHSKSKVILFNQAHKFDFLSKVKLVENQYLEVVEEVKLLGVTVSSNLKWHAHVADVCKRAHAKLWLIRRLINLNATTEILLDLYYKQVRSLMEYAAPLWSPGLTESDKEELERLQKSAFSIIFKSESKSYSRLLSKLNRKSLDQRRLDIYQKFANNSEKH